MADRDRDRLERLVDAPLTYSEVGATAGTLPAGYHHVQRSEVIGRGSSFFTDAADALMSWQMHTRAGLQVIPSASRATIDVVVLMRLGVAGRGLVIPCRVVYEIAEDRRIGFAYGTLPGHPERGEESFVIEFLEDDSVRLQIIAFSQPARWFTRLAAPVSRSAQAFMTDRYIRALRS
jgi:uncharacterized protein (UPF0548 family)